MINQKRRQEGKSAIGNILVLALIGFSVWVGIQFIPQKIEQGSVKSILDDVQERHFATPIRSDEDLWRTIDRYLNLNEMGDMRQYFDVSRSGGGLTVRVNYERDLNLIFTTMQMQYDESVVLN